MQFAVSFKNSGSFAAAVNEQDDLNAVFESNLDPFVVEPAYKIVHIGFSENDLSKKIKFVSSNSVGSRAELYRGNYEVLPSGEPQTLQTQNKYLLEDVVVHSVPTQEKTVVPSFVNQEITPDDGLFFDKVIVEAIPEELTGDIIRSDKLLEGYTAYDDNGTQIAGTMLNRGAFIKDLQLADDIIAIPEGYHNGTGYVSLSANEKGKLQPENIRDGVSILGVDGIYKPDEVQTQQVNIEPTIEDIVVTPDEGKYIDRVTVALSPEDKLAIVPENIVDGVSILGVAGSFKVITQEKAVLPTYNEQEVAPDSGKYLSKVTVSPIPFDLRNDTVAAEYMLAGVTAHDYKGDAIIGTIQNNGRVSEEIADKDDVISLSSGYYSGGSVSINESSKANIVPGNIKDGVTILGVTGTFGVEEIVTQEIDVDPSYEEQIILPDAGKYINKVTVSPIPFDLREDTVTADSMLEGSSAHNSEGQIINGTIVNRGDVVFTFENKNDVFYVRKGYHSGGGYASLGQSDIEAIISANIKDGVTILGVSGTYAGEPIYTQEKTVTPTRAGFEVTPDGDQYLSKVIVGSIPYKVAMNSSGGTTFTIAG